MPTLSDLLAVQAAQGVQSGAQKVWDQDAATKAASAKALSDMLQLKQSGTQDLQKVAATGDETRKSHASSLADDKAMFDAIQPQVANGASFSAGALHSGGDPAMQMQKQLAMMNQRQQNQDAHMTEAQKKAADKAYGSAYKGFDSTLEPIGLIQQIIKDPSSMGDESLKVLKARTVEGAGAKLLQGVVHNMGGNPTMFSKTEDMVNWIKGQANSTMAPEVREKLLQSLKPYVDNAESDMNEVDNKMKSVHDLSYDRLTNGADKYINSFGGPARAKLAKLKSGFAAADAAPRASNPNPVSQGLAGLFGSKTAPATTSSTSAPLSFEDWKKANGR